MQVGHAALGSLHGLVQLLIIVFHKSRGCRGYIFTIVHHHDQRQILGIPGFTAVCIADGCSGSPGTEGGCAGSLHTRIHVAFVVHTNIKDLFAAFGGSGQGLEPDVGGTAVTRQCQHGNITPDPVVIAFDAGQHGGRIGQQRRETRGFGAGKPVDAHRSDGYAYRGKTRDAKYLPLIMVMHNCEYVATASTAFMEDYYEKLNKAMEASQRGMAYLHVFSPCPTGWRFPFDMLIEISRKAVLTNMFPLWEYSAEDGDLKFTHPVDNSLPVQNLLSLIGKYRHLNDKEIEHIQNVADQRIEILANYQKSEDVAQNQ